MLLEFCVNGKTVAIETPPNRRLIDILRNDLNLTGTKESCSEGECGSCTVLLDERAVHSCLTLAIELQGRTVTTIEGLGENGEMDLLQENFVKEGAVQCGYCTPGMIMSAKWLLLKNSNPSDEEIKVAISGNICRCSGYDQIIRAIRKTADAL